MPPSVRDLRRLLNLFPAQSIRGEWEESRGRKKDDVITGVLRDINPDNIVDFVSTNFGKAKQHIHLFEHEAAITTLPDTVFDGFDPESVDERRGYKEYFYLIPLRFEYVASDINNGTPERGEITFPWPVKIIFAPGIARVHLVTMEKHISSYLEDEMQVFNVKRQMENEDLIDILKETLDNLTTLTPIDLNQGVKALWAADTIDAVRGCWKTDNSTRTEAMDKDRLVKRDKPDQYEQAILAPLLKMVFTPLDPETTWPELLMIDATYGEIGISRYTQNPGGIDDVVAEILRVN